jgi:perosamine synthetase
MERRAFLAAGTAGAVVANSDKPAVLGGRPVRSTPFPSWPVADRSEEKAILEVLRSGRWNRGSVVERFEGEYARLVGSAACLATANGTSALLCGLQALGVGPGKEVIVPPYTFIATVNVVLETGAIPVFVDTDRDTFQIDAGKVAAAITERTAAILPVHLGGSTADMDTLLAIGAKHKLPVLEDACQAHLAEWKGSHVGSLGTWGAFSFQASKNLNSGEGGALVSSDRELIERAFTFHNNGRDRKGGSGFTYTRQGLNLRLTEFQAALLLSQMTRLDAQSRRRSDNAARLTSLLAEIPGIRPAKQYEGTTRNAYHLYMFRYDSEKFAGLPRAQFLAALRAEGIPANSGYAPLNKEPFIASTLAKHYAKQQVADWSRRNHCPENDRLCGEAVWLTQTMLLGGKEDMDGIAAAIRRIQAHAGQIAKA